ncbi:MAG: hypothetical protein OEX03_11605 [Gammaproteobacteria bacterium]|nr:hypothetical protein [Gammaproteobacteria bacterium]
MKAPIYALLFLFFSAPLVAANNTMQCHIHPPSLDDETPKLIGPFINSRSCEQERNTRYGSQGRCHCSFSSPMQNGYPSMADESFGRNPQPRY